MIANVVVLTVFICTSRTPQPDLLQSSETQEQQKTPDSLHDLSAHVTGEKVPSETVPLHRGEGRVLQLPQPHRDSSQDLVPKPQGQGQETTGGRAGEIQTGCEASVAGLCFSFPTKRIITSGSIAVPVRGPERTAAGLGCAGTLHWTIWDVLLNLTAGHCDFVRDFFFKHKNIRTENNTHYKNCSHVSVFIREKNVFFSDYIFHSTFISSTSAFRYYYF